MNVAQKILSTFVALYWRLYWAARDMAEAVFYREAPLPEPVGYADVGGCSMPSVFRSGRRQPGVCRSLATNGDSPMSEGARQMSEEMKYAQDVMSKNSSGRAMGGFNTRILGGTNRAEFVHDPEGLAGWELANGMIRSGKLFYVHPFHNEGPCRAFPYGGTWVCNGCGKNRLDKPWWKIKVYKDGNAWCCIGEGFEDLQESDNYSFGNTREEAIRKYGAMCTAKEQDK